MRFFKEFNGFIFEFNSIGEFLDFCLGRIFGVIVFIGLIVGWYFLLYFMGYIESVEPFFRVVKTLWNLIF